jgi:HK97 family phage prohead protease
MPDRLEIRVVEAGELRVESRGVAPVIRGYAIVYQRPSELLGAPAFREQIAPEAITRTLAEGVDLRALVDHNPEKPLGRLSAKTLRVESDAHGLRVEIDPPHTSYGHDIVESIRRGDVQGMSFAFRTVDDRWDMSTTPPLRTVTDMLVREVSVVTFPAYPETEVAMRSLEAVRSRAGSYPRGRTVAERQAWAATQRR